MDESDHYVSNAARERQALQTHAHILQTCSLYENHRDVLRKVSDQLDLRCILGTRKGIEALAKFISLTGAFTKTGDATVD